MSIILKEALQSLTPIPEDLPQRPWLVPGLLMRKQVTLLSAAGGMGKSMLALQIAVMCEWQLAWMGWQPIEKLRVLYIGSEDNLDEKQRRLFAACRVMKCKHPTAFDTLPSFKLVAYDPEADSGPLITTSEQTQLLAIAQQYDIVIIDPLIEFQSGLNENDNTHMEFFATAIRDIARFANCAVLLVHHHRKSGVGGSQDSARGASSLLASVRVALTVVDKKVPDDVSDEEYARLRSYRELQGSKSNYSERTGVVTLQMKSVPLPNGDKVGVFVEPNGIRNVDTNVIVNEVQRRYDEGCGFKVKKRAAKTERLDVWISTQFDIPPKTAVDCINDLLLRDLIEQYEHKDAKGNTSDRYRPGKGQDGIPF